MIMSVKGISLRKRLVEHIITDPFVDLAFIQFLISNEDWLRVIKRQAEIYSITGDIGEDTATFRTYKNEVKQFVIKIFQDSYPGSIEKNLNEGVVDEKATRAWRALVTLLSSQRLIERAGIELGRLLPESYGQLENLRPIVESIVREKTSERWIRGTEVVKRALKNLSVDRMCEVAPLLWWINLVMESEVFQAFFKYHLLFAFKKELIEGFIKAVEDALSEVKGHEADLSYMEHEVLKALLSRCVELRGQYINKLQNAVIFVKLWRKNIKNPEQWDWFLKHESLTYAMSVYIMELQELLGSKEKELNISVMLSPKRGIYSGSATTLSTLILMSPIFMQYALEARGEITVTPADILIAVLRISKSHHKEYFVIDVHDIARKIIDFWEEKDLLRRLKLYAGTEVTSEMLLDKGSFASSLALIINARIDGIHITTEKKPELFLPPRMIGFDSLYIKTHQLLPVFQKIWR
jgi:hypothetical protein